MTCRSAKPETVAPLDPAVSKSRTVTEFSHSFYLRLTDLSEDDVLEMRWKEIALRSIASSLITSRRSEE
jgi:hypothetical protein